MAATAEISIPIRCCCSPFVRAIEVAGEAASKVSEDTRAELPGLPWPAIVGMRNRLIHGYFDIDNDVLWTTVTEAAPPAAEYLKEVLENK